MFGYRRLTDAQLAGYQQAADTILHKVSVYLRRKVLSGLFQPFQNLNSPVITQSLHRSRQSHLDN